MNHAYIFCVQVNTIVLVWSKLMDFEVFLDFFKLLISDGKTGIIMLLLVAIVYLWYDRRRMVQTIERKDRQLERIIRDYHRGNAKIVEALNHLKILLIEIKGRLF